MVRYIAAMRALPILVLVGCGSNPAPPPTTAIAPTEPTVSKPAEPTETKEVKKEPEGPPFVIEKLTVAAKMKGEEVQLLDLGWEVTRKNEVEKGTILLVHSTCKVGYKTNYEDETVAGVDTIPKGEPRHFTVPAYASVGLKFEPAWCTFAFASGPKGGKDETKLTSFCWKKGVVSEGLCG